MEKKNIDWSNIGFGYMPTDYRYVSMYQNGSWDEGALTSDPNITLNECACVLQYAQTCFEGLKAYTTEDGHIVTFRPDLNGERMENSAKGLAAIPEGALRRRHHKSSRSQRSIRTAVWFRCNPVHPPVYVRL